MVGFGIPDLLRSYGESGLLSLLELIAPARSRFSGRDTTQQKSRILAQPLGRIKRISEVHKATFRLPKDGGVQDGGPNGRYSSG